MKNEYRPEIDGLRMIAVLSVIVYHLWPDALPGGYLGVDVFFVISGYLITRIIVTKAEIGAFSFAEFYLRRIRRIIPAQLLVILVTVIGFSILFSKSEMATLGESALFSTLSLSNVYFWLESGYFGALNNDAPLLHMWSLGVEEQFYLFWPTFILLAFRFVSTRLRLVLFGLLFFVSLGATHFLYSVLPSGVFYLFPFRIFEFLCGGALAFTTLTKLSETTARIVSVIALAVIGLSFFIFDETTRHPGILTLAPCLAVGLLIYAAQHDVVTRSVLGNSVFVHLGLLSYSLYLVHWPIVVAAKVIGGEVIGLGEGLGLLALMYGAAALLHYLWEKPLRYGRFGAVQFTRFQHVMIAGVFVLAIIGSSVTWRANTDRLEGVSAADPGHERVITQNSNCVRFVDENKLKECRADILVLGDSHAARTEKTIRVFLQGEGRNDVSLSVWNYVGCPPVFGVSKVYAKASLIKQQEQCGNLMEAWEKNVPEADVRIVVLSARWAWLTEKANYQGTRIREDYLTYNHKPVSRQSARRNFERAIRETVRSLRQSGKVVVLFGQAPLHIQSTFRCAELSSNVVNMVESCPGLPAKEAMERLNFSRVLFTELSKQEGVFFVDPTSAFCSDTECVIRDETGMLYSDRDHINENGQARLAHFHVPLLRSIIETHLAVPSQTD